MRPLQQALLDLLALKALPRAGWLRAGVTTPESVAGHSWGVAWLVLALCPPSLDRGRALAIAVVHDLAEAQVGDITPHDGIAAEVKHAREEEAMLSLLDALPGKDELLSLWREYESGTTEEGRFVKLCDKLDMGLQALCYRQQGCDAAEILASARAALDGELGKLLAETR
jgi:putative hydrolase of HD superfamily